MRSIFFFLLILNLGFALWHFAVGDGSADTAQIREQQIALSHVDAPELQLVSDQGPQQAAADEPAAAQYSVDEMCWMMGPFDQLDTANNIQTRLRSTGVDLAVQKIATPVAPDYWVFVVPQDSRQAAVDLLRDLQRRDIDSFIIAEGELENGISLGFYSREQAATEVLEGHAGQPYQVEMKVVPREIEEFWAVVRNQEFQKLSEQAWQRFQQQNGNVELEQKYCDIVASADNLE